jgi:hypothetical protein
MDARTETARLQNVPRHGMPRPDLAGKGIPCRRF